MGQMKTLAVKLPDSAIKELKEIADAQYIPTRTMIGAWIMQRLNAEMGRTKILEVEPEDDEIEAIREGEKQFATGEYVGWESLKASN
jgi:predicted transcriptional regulator